MRKKLFKKSKAVVIKAGYLGALVVYDPSFNSGCGLSSALAAIIAKNKEQNNNGCYYKNNGNNEDNRPNRDTRRGCRRLAHFHFYKHYRGERGNIHGNFACVYIGHKLCFNDYILVCKVCKGGEAVYIADYGAENAVALRKGDIADLGLASGFNIIEICLAVLLHIVGTSGKFAALNYMNKSRNGFLIVGGCVCLGSVEDIFNRTLAGAFVCCAVNKSGNVECGDCIAVRNKL